jgi:TPR repeat protein
MKWLCDMPMVKAHRRNYWDAMAWFAKAATNGNDNVQWKLGLGYIKGIGVPMSARQWYGSNALQTKAITASAKPLVSPMNRRSWSDWKFTQIAYGDTPRRWQMEDAACTGV